MKIQLLILAIAALWICGEASEPVPLLAWSNGAHLKGQNFSALQSMHDGDMIQLLDTIISSKSSAGNLSKYVVRSAAPQVVVVYLTHQLPMANFGEFSNEGSLENLKAIVHESASSIVVPYFYRVSPAIYSLEKFVTKRIKAGSKAFLLGEDISLKAVAGVQSVSFEELESALIAAKKQEEKQPAIVFVRFSAEQSMSEQDAVVGKLNQFVSEVLEQDYVAVFTSNLPAPEIADQVHDSHKSLFRRLGEGSDTYTSLLPPYIFQILIIAAMLLFTVLVAYICTCQIQPPSLTPPEKKEH